MRLIDADALEKHIKVEGRNQAEQRANRYDNVVLAYGDCFGMVRDAPTIDAVPVVRCRECKSHGTLKSGELFCGKIKTGMYGYHYTVKADDYCSYGERKEG